MISIDTLGTDKCIEQMRMLQGRMQTRAQAAVDSSVHEGLWKMRELTPYRTGKLQKGDKARQVSSAISWLIDYELYNDVDYAIWVCFGTRKMRARDFMTPAREYARQRLDYRMNRILE